MDNSAAEWGSLGRFACLVFVLGGPKRRTSCCSEAWALLFRGVGTGSGVSGNATPKAARKEAASFGGKPVRGETSGIARRDDGGVGTNLRKSGTPCFPIGQLWLLVSSRGLPTRKGV